MTNSKLYNMCMIYDNDENILVQDRIKKDWPGITFPGGKVEINESIIESVIREVKEETGLVVTSLKLCGLKDWVDNGTRHLILFFKTNAYSGDIISSDEGSVFWIKKDELKNYKLANDFQMMFEVFENEDLSEFYYDINLLGEWIPKLF